MCVHRSQGGGGVPGAGMMQRHQSVILAYEKHDAIYKVFVARGTNAIDYFEYREHFHGLSFYG